MGSALGPDIGRFFTLAFHGLKHGKADTHGQYLMIIHHCLEKVLRLPHFYPPTRRFCRSYRSPPMQSDKRQLEPFMPMVIDGTKAVLEAATSATILYPAVLVLQARAALPVVCRIARPAQSSYQANPTRPHRRRR